MNEIFGSQVKVLILLYLGLRGGASGRYIAKVIKKGTSQVFKALNQLEDNNIIRQDKKYHLYFLNPDYPYFEELISIIDKAAQYEKKLVTRFFPILKRQREVDPLSVYQILELRQSTGDYQKLSDVLKEKYG